MDKNNNMNDSSNINSSFGKRKLSSPNWYHKSDVFEGNNATSIRKVEICSSSVVGTMDENGIVDLTLDTDDVEEALLIKKQQVLNVDFIREYWWLNNEQQEAVDINLLVSTYIYAAKSRSLCTEATIRRLKLGDEETGHLVLIDKSCINRLDEDIEIIDKAKTSLQDQCNQEDEVFNLAKQHWKETEQKYKVSKASNIELKTYIGQNKSHLSTLRAAIIRQQTKLLHKLSHKVSHMELKGTIDYC